MLLVWIVSSSVCVPDGELEQIDFIDSCAGEEEEEEGRSRGGGDRTSLSSQFMAYIERRITREVRAPPTGSHTCDSHASHNCLSSFNYSLYSKPFYTDF